jgi:hypothetical protein
MLDTDGHRLKNGKKTLVISKNGVAVLRYDMRRLEIRA